MEPATEQAWSTSLMSHEGNKLRVYDDATGKTIAAGTLVRGNPSIGVGRNLADPGITEAESSYLLTNDRTRVKTELDLLCPWWTTMNEARQLALAELAFNIGTAKLVAKWPKTMEYLQQGAYTLAGNEVATNTVWCNEVGPTRSAWIIRLIESGMLV